SSASDYTVFEGDTITVQGVVWARDKDDLNHGMVESKVRLTGPGADITVATDKVGYFEVNYPILDSNRTLLVIEGIPLDPKKYFSGTDTIHLEIKKKGAREITAATDKPIYKRGEEVTVSGNVTQDGKP